MEKKKHEAIVLMESVFRYCTDGYIYTVLLHKNYKTNGIEKIKYFELSKITLIPNYISILINNFDCYFSPTVCSKDLGCHGRSRNDIKQWPVFWCDINIYKFDENKQREIWKLINDFLLQPSFIIKSGKGIHVYWILKEPATDRDLIKNYLDRLAINFSGDRGSAEVAHLLRIPQTKNHKYNSPENGVSIIGSNPGKEYHVDDFDILPLAMEISAKEERPYSQEANERLNQIMECKFLRHCDQDRVTLSEPEWYAMISILARENGRSDFIHNLSRGYPGYLPQETDKKILHAINDAGPATCERVKGLWACEKDCGIRSPAVLALKAKRDESRNHPYVETYDDGALCHESIEVSHEIETLRDLLNKELIPRDSIVGDGLIARKDFVIFSGPQKKGKSLASLNLAINVAQGRSWLGFDISYSRRVGIVQQEIPEESLKDRLEKMLKGVEDRTFLDRIPHLTRRGLKLDSAHGNERASSMVGYGKGRPFDYRSALPIPQRKGERSRRYEQSLSMPSKHRTGLQLWDLAYSPSWETFSN